MELSFARSTAIGAFMAERGIILSGVSRAALPTLPAAHGLISFDARRANPRRRLSTCSCASYEQQLAIVTDEPLSDISKVSAFRLSSDIDRAAWRNLRGSRRGQTRFWPKAPIFLVPDTFLGRRTLEPFPLDCLSIDEELLGLAI